MNGRKFILGIVSVTILSANAIAGGMLKREAIPTIRDEGDAPIEFAVSCSSTAWTAIIASDTIRRSWLVQASSSNAVAACVSITSAAASVACLDSTPGIELLAGSSFTDYTKAAWRCRARANVGTAIAPALKGYTARDSADYGWIKP